MISNKRFSGWLNIAGSLVLGLSLAIAAPTAAQENEATGAGTVAGEVQADPHEDLLNTVDNAGDMDAYLDRMAALAAEQLVYGTAAIRRSVDDHDGLIKELTVAFRPGLGAYSKRSKAKHRPSMLNALKETLSHSEAREINAFYNKPIGQRLLEVIWANSSSDQVISDAIAQREITQSAVESDLKLSEQRAIAALSEKEIELINTEAAKIQGIEKMLDFQAKAAKVRTAMELEPLTPEEEEMIEEAITPVLEKYFRAN